MPRRLSLKKETLAELGDTDLRNVVGGLPTTTWILPTQEPCVPTWDQCPLNGTGYYLTVPLHGCVGR
jgi:hypothetical protein